MNFLICRFCIQNIREAGTACMRKYLVKMKQCCSFLKVDKILYVKWLSRASDSVICLQTKMKIFEFTTLKRVVVKKPKRRMKRLEFARLKTSNGICFVRYTHMTYKEANVTRLRGTTLLCSMKNKVLGI